MKVNNNFHLFYLLLAIQMIFWSQSWAQNRTQDHSSVVTSGKPGKVLKKLNYQFVFQNRNFPLKVRVFEAAKQKIFRLGREYTANSIQELPVVREYPNQVIDLYPGDETFIIFAVENTQDKDHFFYATPHAWDPEEDSLGSKLYCLCYNRIYRVPAKKVWFRVAQLGIEKNALGESMKIIHRVVGVDKNRALDMTLRQEN